ncbi:TetR family transcriptional regulator [Paracoccus aminophilus]|nr:TetR family transcriptional regulator [Paracoccus aminophilus]
MNTVIDIVSREGLAAATVRRIAQELGCSPGQIHHHFTSAEMLRAEAVREVWARLEPALLEAMMRRQPRERLLSVLSGCENVIGKELGPIMDVAERLWHEARGIRHESAVRDAIAHGINRMSDFVIATLQEGVEAGIFPPDLEVRQVAIRLISAAQGYDLLEETGSTVYLGADRATFFDELLRREKL